MWLSRRDVIGVGAAAVVLGGVGAVAALTQPHDAAAAPLRPPGGQDEGLLLAQCMRCDRCRSACPTNCIAIGVIEDGLMNVRTPVMNYHVGGCVFCDKCIDACPTDVLRPFDPHADKIGMAVVDGDVCIAFRSPGACKRCQDACQYKAIAIVGGHPKVVRDRCNGCGLCESVCPPHEFDASQGAYRHGIDVFTLASVLPREQDRNAVQDGETIPDEQFEDGYWRSAAATSASGSGASSDGERRASSSGVADASSDGDGFAGNVGHMDRIQHGMATVDYGKYVDAGARRASSASDAFADAARASSSADASGTARGGTGSAMADGEGTR